jgi:general stress protein 26
MEKNLHNTEAIKKLQELVSDIKTCMMITSGKTGALASRPMAAVDTDDSGNIWFYTSLDSNKIKDIEIDHFAQLIFAHPGKDSYLDVRGRINVITDKNAVREKWNWMIKAWFPDGIDSPDICLLQVKTDEVHYWDTENSKMVQVLKAALSIVAGKPLVEGVHGELNL